MRSLCLARVRLGAAALPLVLLSCGDGGGPTGPDPDVVVAVAVSALGPSSFPAGEGLQLEAIPLNALGDPVPGRTILWESLTALVAEVDATGWVIGVGMGDARVRATVGEQFGEIDLTVELPPPPPLPLEIQVQPVSMSQVNFAWSWSGGTSLLIRIEREVLGPAGVAGATGAFSEIASIPAEVGGYADVDLSPGTRYRYRLRSCSAFVCSEYSEPIERSTYAPLSVSGAELPIGVVGQLYLAQLIGIGGDGAYSWSLADGSLPPGITLSPDGALGGSPTSPGTTPFRLELRSGDGQGVEADYAIEVVAPLQIEGGALPDGEVAAPYEFFLAATGGRPPYAWGVVIGALPDGLALDGPTGRIAGAPTAEGLSPVTLLVTSADGQGVAGEFTIRIVPTEEESAVPVVLLNRYLPVAIAGEFYSQAIGVQGGNGVAYEFELVEGALPEGLQVSSEGIIEGFPSGSGTAYFALLVSSGGFSATRVFALSVSTVPASGFNIAIVSGSDAIPPVALRTALDAAVARWEAVIISDLPEFQIPSNSIPGSSCQGHWLKFRPGEVIDDLAIVLEVADLPGNTVGTAGPCGIFRSGGPAAWLFPTGSVKIDGDFIGAADGHRLSATLIHEIGHVLGFGTIWQTPSWNYLDGAGGNDPRFVGAQGVAAYKLTGGSDANIPVENEGSTGTRDSHWREFSFDREVMTGLIEPNGVFMPLSRMTIGSLGDLGYGVNLAAADAFAPAPPGAPPGPEGIGAIDLRDDVVIEPYYILLPDGTIEVIDPPALIPR